MEKMQFSIFPSLEHISNTKIATTLWNVDDIRNLIVQYFSQSLFHWEIEWEKIENKVTEKVSSIFLPGDLKEKVRNIIKPIGYEILGWLKYQKNFVASYEYEGFVEKCLNDISWTSVGNIDREKTVKRLIQERSIHIGIRYKLACFYCFENDIQKLWTKLPEDLKRSFYWDELDVFEIGLVFYWSSYVNKDLNKLMDLFEGRNINLYMLYYAMRRGCKKAVKYFLYKLSYPVRTSELVKAATHAAQKNFAKMYFEVADDNMFVPSIPSKDYSSILCFLLSQMNGDQLRQIFKICPEQILKSFLRWPLQSLFIELARSVCQFISEKEFDSVLFYLLRYLIFPGITDYNYQELLGEFWQQSPIHLKKYVLREGPGFLFSTLLRTDDRKNISLILQNASIEEREQIFFDYFLDDVVYEENWDFLKFYVPLCISSKEKMIEFKQKCDNCLIDWEHENSKLEKFSEVLSTLTESFDVHNFVNHEYHPSKKLCV